MTETASIGRRDLLRKGLILGGAGTAAGLLVTSNVGCATAQDAEAPSVTKVTYDVACNGDTLRIIPVDGNEEGDLRGNSFYVEGWVYAADTISGEGFDPSSAEALGTWICRGWFMINADRAEPHVITTQEYVLGAISPTSLFPIDTLTSSGMEGSDSEEQPPVRSVIGGTGRYAAASGVVVQHGNGKNTTELKGIGDKAPNFRFDFHLVVPELNLDLGL